MPGIPDVGANGYISFWISFWAALYSGALYSVITGIVVGLVVLGVQRNSENRRIKRESDRDLAIFRQKLRTAVFHPDVIMIDNFAGAVPKSVVHAMTVIEHHPIDIWAEALPHRIFFIANVSKLRKAYTDFLSQANPLDLRLQMFIRRHNAAQNIDRVNDGADIAYFVGRTNGSQPEELLPWLNMPAVALPRLEASYSAALTDAEIPDRVQSFKVVAGFLEEVLDGLRQALNSSL